MNQAETVRWTHSVISDNIFYTEPSLYHDFFILRLEQSLKKFITSTMQNHNHVVFACMGFSWGLEITLYKKAKTYYGVGYMKKWKTSIWFKGE